MNLPSDQHKAEHTAEAIQKRLSTAPKNLYLGDLVFGAIDGSITTFAIVGGAMGAGLSPQIVLVLGCANLLADGFSMAVGNYLGTKSEHQKLEHARNIEERHLDVMPEGERQEIRQIFANKGLSGDALGKIIEVVTSQRSLWIETMLTEEWGLHTRTRLPLRAAYATFIAFVIVGAIPLLPFLFGVTPHLAFTLSWIFTGFAFASIGFIKGVILQRPLLIAAAETLLTGAGAALIAYAIGVWLKPHL